MPETEHFYVVGDVHGQLAKLDLALARIERDQAENGAGRVVFAGDLVDRGPDSRGVVQRIIDGIAAGKDWVVLKGNHDRMMAMWLREVPERDPRLRSTYDWVHPRLGGRETLASYGVDISLDDTALHADARVRVPTSHREFLEGLPLTAEFPDTLVVHAGIRPGVPIEEQAEDDLLWIRDGFHVSTADHGPLVIHGHTPVDAVTHYGNRVNVDTGAGFGGPLSVVAVLGREIYELTSGGRVPVRPPERL